MEKIKNLVIVGGRSNAFIALNIIKNTYENIFYFSDREYDKHYYTQIGFKILDSFEETIELIKINDYFISCGGNKERAWFYNRIKSLINKNPINIIHPQSYIEPNVTIGFGNLINFGCYININTIIGNLNILNTYSIIEHDNIIGDLNHLAPRSTTTGFTKIGNRNEIFTSATIIPFKTIKDDIIVGAGGVVIKDLQEPGTYVNIPATKKNKI